MPGYASFTEGRRRSPMQKGEAVRRSRGAFSVCRWRCSGLEFLILGPCLEASGHAEVRMYRGVDQPSRKQFSDPSGRPRVRESRSKPWAPPLTVHRAEPFTNKGGGGSPQGARQLPRPDRGNSPRLHGTRYKYLTVVRAWEQRRALKECGSAAATSFDPPNVRPVGPASKWA